MLNDGKINKWKNLFDKFYEQWFQMANNFCAASIWMLKWLLVTPHSNGSLLMSDEEIKNMCNDV